MLSLAHVKRLKSLVDTYNGTSLKGFNQKYRDKFSNKLQRIIDEEQRFCVPDNSIYLKDDFFMKKECDFLYLVMNERLLQDNEYGDIHDVVLDMLRDCQGGNNR